MKHKMMNLMKANKTIQLISLAALSVGGLAIAAENDLIFWSSTLESGGHRIYATRTSDGKTFSAAKVFLDPKYSCIDGMMALDENVAAKRWVLVYKNEEEPSKGGKNLRLATAPADFSQPWSLVETPVAPERKSARQFAQRQRPDLTP